MATDHCEQFEAYLLGIKDVSEKYFELKTNKEIQKYKDETSDEEFEEPKEEEELEEEKPKDLGSFLRRMINAQGKQALHRMSPPFKKFGEMIYNQVDKALEGMFTKSEMLTDPEYFKKIKKELSELEPDEPISQDLLKKLIEVNDLLVTVTETVKEILL